MSKIYFFIIVVITMLASFKTTAAEYLPMIEEGSEFKYYYREPYSHSHTYYTLIIGADSVFNDKTYKRCNWHVKDYADDGWEIENLNDITKTKGLVREDNGKVWMIFDSEDTSIPAFTFGAPDTEFLIYDMNIEPKEFLAVVPDEILYNSDLLHRYGGFLLNYRPYGRFQLLEKYKVSVLGQERIVQKYHVGIGPRPYLDRVDIIEGIGMIDNIMLFPFFVNIFTSYVNRPELVCKKNPQGEIEYNNKEYNSVRSILEEDKFPRVYSENDEIIILGNYSSYSVTDISGRSWNTLKVPAGLYIVTVDGQPHKVMVK